MMNNKMIGDAPSGTLGVLIDLLGKLKHGSVAAEDLLRLARKKRFAGDPLDAAPESVLAALSSLLIKLKQKKISLEELEALVKKECYFQSADELREINLEWLQFYREVFGSYLNIDGHHFSAAAGQLPQYRPGFGWLMFIPGGLTLDLAIEACRDEFPVEFSLAYVQCKWAHCRSGASFNSHGSYYLGVRNRIEADKNLLGLSAGRIWEQEISSINLIEMLILHLKHFLDTKQHLNIKTRTICAGSWLDNQADKAAAGARGELAPYVFSLKGRVYIGVIDRTFKSPKYGTREIAA